MAKNGAQGGQRN